MEKNNLSYIFIPFYFDNEEEYKSIVSKCNDSGFTRLDDDYKYLFKYVTERMGKREYSHFVNKTLEPSDKVYESFYSNGKRDEEGNLKFKAIGADFQILEAQVYCFNTGVCIFVFAIHFKDDEPFKISENLYNFKKVGRTYFRLKGTDDERITFLDYARKLIGNQNFMYFQNSEHERSNILTYLEVDAPADGSEDLPETYKKELFFLRNCYGKNYTYDEKYNVCPEGEFHYHSKYVIWGLTNEAAVCLACPDMDKTNFIRNHFYPNFRKQYFSMYILLLHQKYVLYMFLMKIIDLEEAGKDQQEQLRILEQYKATLYDFEKDFLFSCVTEVPQYQMLYTKIYKQFSIADMVVDVHEPIRSIGSIKREQYEESVRKEDEKQNGLLFFLALLGIASALVDSFDYIEKTLGIIAPSVVVITQIIAFLIIVIGTIWFVWKAKKKDVNG